MTAALPPPVTQSALGTVTAGRAPSGGVAPARIGSAGPVPEEAEARLAQVPLGPVPPTQPARDAAARDGAAVEPPALDPSPAAASGPVPSAGPPAGPALPDFLAGSETRLRDLLAYAMAVEAARPLGPDGVEGLRRKADAELRGHAFRELHNRVEDIRRDAMDEQVARMPRGLSFSAVVAANLAALGLGATLALLVWLASPLLTAGS